MGNKMHTDLKYVNVLFKTILVGLILMVLLGCGLNISASSAAPTATDFVVATKADVVNLDPALASDSASLLVARQIYDTLIIYQPGGTLPQPGLAESWSNSDDRLSWTFNLRSNLKFHDNTTLDADAVVFNLQRWWDPANPYHVGDFPYFSDSFGGYKGEPNCIITAVAAIGNSQVVITLSSPQNTFISKLGVPAFAIASPTAIQAGTLSTHPVGSGPFKFGSRVIGDRVSLNANPDYWGAAPRLSTLTFKVIVDDTARYNALSSGTAHSAVQLPTSFANTAASDPNLRVLWKPMLITGYLGINRSHTPFDNVLVRQAIAHAINKANLINTQYSIADRVANEFLPPAQWGFKPGLEYAYDPTLAQSLLTQAGYPTGFATTLAYPAMIRPYMPNPGGIAAAIKADLQAVGITVTLIQNSDWANYLQKTWAGDYDLHILGWGASFPHPDSFFSGVLCDPTRLGFGSLDVTLCNSLQTALTEPLLSNQVSLYQAASQQVHDTLPLVPLAHTRSALITAKNVAGLSASPFEEAYKDVYFTTITRSFLPVVKR
jgi:peptide/nickel transport system substrate-binding protein